LIVSIVIGVVFLYPKYQKFTNLQDKLSQKENELENQQSYLKFLNQINEKVKEKKDLMDKVTSAIPNEAEIPSFLNFLQEEARNTGVGLEDVNWRERIFKNDEQKQTEEYLIDIQVSGSYLAFRNFLSVLESSARLIEILTTDFTMTTTAAEEPTIFNLQLKIHSY